MNITNLTQIEELNSLVTVETLEMVKEAIGEIEGSWGLQSVTTESGETYTLRVSHIAGSFEFLVIHPDLLVGERLHRLDEVVESMREHSM